MGAAVYIDDDGIFLVRIEVCRLDQAVIQVCFAVCRFDGTGFDAWHLIACKGIGCREQIDTFTALYVKDINAARNAWRTVLVNQVASRRA